MWRQVPSLLAQLLCSLPQRRHSRMPCTAPFAPPHHAAAMHPPRRYHDEEAEAAAAAAAQGPVQRSQGADLAQLLAQAEQFDRSFYHRCVQAGGNAQPCRAVLQGSIDGHCSWNWRPHRPCQASFVGRMLARAWQAWGPSSSHLGPGTACRVRVNLTQELGLPPEPAGGGFQVGAGRGVTRTRNTACMPHAPPC